MEENGTRRFDVPGRHYQVKKTLCEYSIRPSLKGQLNQNLDNFSSAIL